MKKQKKDHSIIISGVHVPPGGQTLIDVPVSPLYTRTPMSIPVHVLNGFEPGPRLFITSAVHGDEINGVEIIRRLISKINVNKLKGTVIALPIVNVFGFLYRSRYLPDRRDLNRSFPGSNHGSLAARIAKFLMEEIIDQCTHGIDLHTGPIHRENLPQVRANLNNSQTMALAKAFPVPVLMNGNVVHGSLRGQAVEQKIPTLLYEAGEALRINEDAIKIGVKGILGVMRALKMLPKLKNPRPTAKPFIARSSVWIRANHAGLVLSPVALGTHVVKDQRLAIIVDPIMGDEIVVKSPCKGLIVGINKLPLVNEGEALFHIARGTPNANYDLAADFNEHPVDDDDIEVPAV
jgi:predicted deacylase